MTLTTPQINKTSTVLIILATSCSPWRIYIVLILRMPLTCNSFFSADSIDYRLNLKFRMLWLLKLNKIAGNASTHARTHVERRVVATIWQQVNTLARRSEHLRYSGMCIGKTSRTNKQPYFVSNCVSWNVFPICCGLWVVRVTLAPYLQSSFSSRSAIL